MGEKSGSKLSKRRVLRRKEARRLKEEAGKLLGKTEPNTIDEAEIEDGTVVYIVDGDVQLARKGGLLFPTLTNSNISQLPSVFVDRGAIPYVCNGADVMAPGVKEIRGEFEEGSLVVVRDIEHSKALAVGTALFTSGELRKMNKGKAVRTLHFVGDKLWKVVG